MSTHTGRCLILELAIKALTEPLRQVILDTICQQFHNVRGSVENSGAVGTALEVSLHPCTQLWIYRSVDVIGDLSPDFDAASLNHLPHRTHPAAFGYKVSVSRFLPRPYFLISRLTCGPTTVNARGQRVSHLQAGS